jgi:GNAT superfamily N-acetyltransferase
MERELRKSKKVERMEKVEPAPDEVLIESVGVDVNEAMRFFRMAGLNEAFLVLRRYRELSDGQKYRYRLAKLLATGADVWIMDEFCATLDRDTAKVTAFCLQKLARREGKTVIVATTHRDLIGDFNPNVLIQKRIGSDAEVTYNQVEPRSCSLMKEIKVGLGTIKDYEKLSRFHYLAGKPAVIRHILKADHRGETVGIIVYVYPSLNSAPRNRVFPQYRIMGKERARRVNAEIVRIARVILHPKYRSIGLGYRLVRETMESLPYRVIETYAVMARYNPFFEKAGMTKVEVHKTSREVEVVAAFLEDHGFDLNYLRSTNACRKFLAKISPKTRRELTEILRKNARAYMNAYPKVAAGLLRKIEAGDLVEPMKKSIPMDTLYFYWINPRWRAQR